MVNPLRGMKQWIREKVNQGEKESIMTFMFNLFAFLYIVAPLIVIPYWAYSNSNGYLLFGILFSWFSSYTSFQRRQKILFLFQIICIGFWIKSGFSIHQYITFFFFCSLWGYLSAQIAEGYDQLSKRGTLENDAERLEFHEKNPNHLKEKLEKWREQNPDKQLTYDVIDALAKDKNT